MGFQTRLWRLGVVSLMALVMSSCTTYCESVSESSKDVQECTDQLVGLATCLPYVGGDAKTPTPDCCSGLKQVLKTNKTCLCIIVKDKDDPQLGLNINASLALGLPSVCNAPANVSQCPALLHLDPNSPEAQVFLQFANGSHASASSPEPVEGSSSSTGRPTASSPANGNTGRRERSWLRVAVLAGHALLFMSSLHLLKELSL